jgi:carbon-monoxide dehydrogenase small subunit
MSIRFHLNGRGTELEAPPDTRVIDLLREDLGLTGAKEPCGGGECGACTVLVDGEARLACLMLAGQLEGREVLTIEGLAGEGEVHPLQEAFVENGAVQCGFCTPGMILAAEDLLRRNPSPDRGAVRRGLSGNLCRCTGYVKIVDAVLDAAGRTGRRDEP